MTGIKNCSSDNSAARSASSSLLATASDNVVVGLDDDLLAIKEQLCGQSACLQIIPIVGMGGIGKTTLARNAYHDPLIRDVFHIGGWVTVSQSYSLDDILSRLHQSLKLFDAKRLEESHGSEDDVSEQATDEPATDLFEENDESEFPEEDVYEQANDLFEENDESEFPDAEKPEPPAKVFEESHGSEEDVYEQANDLFEENDESEFPDAEKPEPPAKVFEESHGSEEDVYEQANDLFEENDESEFPDAKRPESPAKMFEESHGSEEDVYEQANDLFEENDESEFPDAKRPESPAKVFEESHGSEEDVYEQPTDEPANGLFEENKESKGDQVYQTLKGRKYLIVMDDIWNSEVCDHLKRVFPNDGNGSRIILTTRLHDVATYAVDCSPHEMQLMRENQSWNLLRQKVFSNGVCNHELENIGMSIARSCGGLPLAIVVIAGLLATVEKTQASWEEIAEKVNSTIAAKDGQFERIFSLSYTHLPRHLRQCFVYMGGFQKNREIHVAKLIKLWVAEGFVGDITASKSMEEEAEECLQDLIKRSLVLVGTRKPQGEIKSCSLHDLMRDLCVRKADEEKFPLYDMDAGRTLVERFKEGSSEDVRHLRVMEVGKYVWDRSSPGYLFRLSKLRYLALAYNFWEISTALSYLENLQTLIIYTTEGLVCLPPEIWTMPQLRHLISSFEQLPYPEGGANSLSLETLQTLNEVRNLECTDRFMAMIPNIKKLGLLYCASYEFVQAYHLDNFWSCLQLEKKINHAPCYDYHDYHLENLECLHQLDKLKLRVDSGFQGIINPVFPVSLKKLSLRGWRFPSWKGMTIVGSLPNLKVLKLRHSGGQDGKWETTEGEFARLRYLLIESSDLREWITEPEHFPNLKQLRLIYCSCLHEIPAGIGDIPTLELISVWGVSPSLVSSVVSIGKEQKDMGNNCLQIHFGRGY